MLIISWYYPIITIIILNFIKKTINENVKVKNKIINVLIVVYIKVL